MMKKIYLFALLILSSFSLLNAENIRGPVSGVLSLDGQRSITTRVEHLSGIVISDVSPLIQGIRLTIHPQNKMTIYRNSFALYLYNRLNKDFSEDDNSYKGSQSFMHFMTFSDELSILIPLDANHTLSPDRSSFLLSDKDNSSDFPMILSIIPITKGIPDSAYSEDIRVEISPVYFNKGLLNLSITNDQGDVLEDSVYVSIDNKNYDWPGGPFLLNTGFHNLTIRTEDGEEESISFTLSPGETINLDHALHKQLPLLSIETVEGLLVYLDERLLSSDELENTMEIQAGSHSIRFELGGFKISRDFTAEMKERIEITMIPEILLNYR